MTTAGAACIAMCAHFMKKKFKKNANFKAAVKWIANNFAVDKNPGHANANSWLYYYLYGLERIGQFLEEDTFGEFDWYKEGARWLIDNQKGDGTWSSGAKTHEDKGRKEGWHEGDVTDTCFAILFLKRADAPLTVESGGGRK
jgi:hypothetical protein